MTDQADDLAEALRLLRGNILCMTEEQEAARRALLAKYPEAPKLLPCPFPSVIDSSLRVEFSATDDEWAVECGCGARGPAKTTEAEAVAA